MKIKDRKSNTESDISTDQNANSEESNSDSAANVALPENQQVKEDKAKEERERKLRENIQKNYVRIGDKYFKIVFKPDKHGRAERTYLERQKGTIVDDFGRKNLKYIKAYDGFCFVPSHTDFKQEVNGFFNEYYPLSHKLASGTYGTIYSILTHVFGDHVDFAMDYIQLLFQKPTQRLPIILLESRSKNTGKSTFGTLLKYLFEDNAIKLGNSDFESDFNALWIKSLCVIVDETSLDKKGIMQMIKRLSTETSKVTSNEKNRAQTQIDFIGKFVFMSNDEGNALPIEKGDPRFAVFKVPTFKERGIKDNPNIEQNIRNEIPAFLHFLSKRELKHSDVGRMYFAKEVYFTPQLAAYYKGNHSNLAKAIIQMVNDSFSFFQEESLLRFSATDLLNMLRLGEYTAKTDRMYLKKVLESELSLEEHAKGRYEFFNMFHGEQILGESNSISQNNRFYEFKKGQFDNPED